MGANKTLLMIGNSRLHWAEFSDGQITNTFHTGHGELPENVSALSHFASVVPSQTSWIQGYFPDAQEITLADIPLKNLYRTLGIDRALAILGAGENYGYPCLVIDGGTALTFSGVDGDRQFVGGAILPGLRLQFQMLAQSTAALPDTKLPEQLPSRWATDTKGAIASGILHTVSAGLNNFVDDWLKQYPASSVLITGGDGQFLAKCLQSEQNARYVPDLVMQGLMSALNLDSV